LIDELFAEVPKRAVAISADSPLKAFFLISPVSAAGADPGHHFALVNWTASINPRSKNALLTAHSRWIFYFPWESDTD